MLRGVPEPAIEVHELRKRYGDVEAVRGLSFRVDRGEVVGLLGPNGAGKTTTVEILEGYRGRTGGEVSVLGYDPANAPLDLRRRVGIVLQSAGFYPRVTVAEALRHFAGYYPAPRDPRETVALVGLESSADVRVNRLSGGQRRRLDLALALVGDPELVFLDEPTTGFDPAARRRSSRTASRSSRTAGSWPRARRVSWSGRRLPTASPTSGVASVPSTRPTTRPRCSTASPRTRSSAASGSRTCT
jgi:ABC-2 type transport system ATP-binding protein